MRYPFFHDGHFFGAKPIGHYELNPFPGCNQMVVSNHSCIYSEYRGQGLGQILAEEKISTAKEEGFDYMIATVVSTNTAQLKIMEKNGWKLLDTFFNRESGNEVNIFGRRLSE
jgi:L-amino acid N-acyltransferase YncA